jgi:hypothetical protein
MDDRTVRPALERHWKASDASDFSVEHDIYHEDAVSAANFGVMHNAGLIPDEHVCVR